MIWMLLALFGLADLILAVLYCDACHRNEHAEARLAWIRSHEALEACMRRRLPQDHPELVSSRIEFCMRLEALSRFDRRRWCSIIAKALGR